MAHTRAGSLGTRKGPFVRVCIVDDHEVVREGLAAALERDGEFTVVGHAGSGTEALATIVALRPDVAVVDFRLPDMTGAELCARIRARSPKTAVVVLSTYLSEEVVRTSMDSGAAAYITKAAGLAEVRTVLHQIAVDGGSPNRESVSAIVHRLFTAAQGGADHGALTPRQEAVLSLAAEGLTYARIAERLGISQSTVRFHIQVAKDRLGARSKTELVSMAIRNALIPPARDAMR